MSTLMPFDELKPTTDELKFKEEQLLESDPELRDRLMQEWDNVPPPPRGVDPDRWRSAIILKNGAPAYTIINNNKEIKYNNRDLASAIWIERLSIPDFPPQKSFPAVGRIDIENYPKKEYAGTGWFIKEDIIVTNRHVATQFIKESNGKFIFSIGNTLVDTSIDLLREEGNKERFNFKLKELLYMEPRPGPDIAFFSVYDEAKEKPDPIPLYDGVPYSHTRVVVIGYPGFTQSHRFASLIFQVFGNVFGVKRISPGTVTPSSGKDVLHTCSTLPGSSGSPVINLQTGEAVALHYQGDFEKTNYAVPMPEVIERLNRL